MKKLFAILMSIMMIACFMPTMAFADTTPEDTPSVGFTATGYKTGKLTGVSAGLTYQIGDGNVVEITSADDVSLDNLGPCTIKVVKKATDPSTKTDSAAQEITVTRAATPTNLKKTEPATINGKGTIATTTAHEYSTDASEPKTYENCTENMTVDPGTTYYIRVKANQRALASESHAYSVTAFVPNQEATPKASFEANGADSGTLSNVASGMQYSIKDGDWVNIESNTVNIASGVTKTAGIKVKKPGNGTTTTDSEIQAITVTQKDAPTDEQVKAVDCTSAGNDGKLTGVTVAMEYRKADTAKWTIGTDAEITGLTAGTYYVRTKASGAELASDSITLEIKGFPTATADVPDVIKGITTVELEAKEITITLTSATLQDVTKDDLVSAWFDTLPAGLKATVKEVKDNTVTITISGTPTKEGKATAKITIPQDKLVDGKEGGLPVANDVTFSIAKYYHVVTGGGGGGAAAKPTQPTTPEQKPATAAGKTAANTAITTAAAANKYDKAEQAEVDQIVKDAEAKIKEAKTEDEVKAIQKDAEAKLDKILTTEEKATIASLEEVSKRDFGTKSKKITKKNGKKAVKLSWAAPEGVDVDGYEIFRSTKKNSGYGTEPYFETPKTSYTNSKGLKSGKTYYYRVRAYVEINGERHYTDYSTKASRKI